MLETEELYVIVLDWKLENICGKSHRGKKISQTVKVSVKVFSFSRERSHDPVSMDLRSLTLV